LIFQFLSDLNPTNTKRNKKTVEWIKNAGQQVHCVQILYKVLGCAQENTIEDIGDKFFIKTYWKWVPFLCHKIQASKCEKIPHNEQ